MDRESVLAELSRQSRVWGTIGGSEDKTSGLIQLCREWIKPDCDAAEIGCFAGVSTSVIACFARTVLAVDPWTLNTGYGEVPRRMLEEAEARFLLVCERFPNITRVRDFSVSAAAGVPDGSLDFVYVDGAHSREAFLADVRAWRPKLKPGGVLAGHDFGLVAGFFGEAGLAGVEAIYPDSSWVTRVPVDCH